MVHSLFRYFFLIIAASLIFSGSVNAANDTATSNRASTEQVTATLLSAYDTVRPGDELWVGLHQKIIPHWHTYWINPGDSGTESQIEWTLPEGVEAGDIHWPAPSRHQLGTITNYGYSDQVTLLVPLRISSDVAVGQLLNIQALAKWLVCEEACLPQSVNLALSLPVVPKDQPQGPANSLITDALTQLPKPGLWAANAELHQPAANSAQSTTNVLVLRLRDAATALSVAKDIFFYADTWGRVVHGAEQQHSVDGNDFLITLRPGESPLQAGESLSGVLVIKEENAGQSIAKHFSLGAQVSAALAPGNANISGGWLELLSAAGLALLGGGDSQFDALCFPGTID